MIKLYWNVFICLFIWIVWCDVGWNCSSSCLSCYSSGFLQESWSWLCTFRLLLLFNAYMIRVRVSSYVYQFYIHSFIQAISIAPVQVRYYFEALPTQHWYCARVLRRSATGNYELRTCPRSYVATKTGFEPTTFWSKGFDSTNAPPCPTLHAAYSIIIIIIIFVYW